MVLPWQQNQWNRWVLQQERISHAYLLSGVSGIGLTLFANKMAQGLLCEKKVTMGCNSCQNCHLFSINQSPDLFRLTILENKKDISVSQVRDLIDKVYTTSHQGGYKVVLIERVETLNTSAFNALLKTLEEPPPFTVLILTSYRSQRLPATILSRCQIIDFYVPLLKESEEWLQHKYPQIETTLIKKALRASYGAPIKAQTWLNEGWLEIQNQWSQDFNDLQIKNKTVSEVVDSWLKQENPQLVLDYFYQRSVEVIRQALYKENQAYNQNVMTFQTILLQAKKIWEQNVNKSLLLENICLIWLALDKKTFHQLSKPLLDYRIMVRG